MAWACKSTRFGPGGGLKLERPVVLDRGHFARCTAQRARRSVHPDIRHRRHKTGDGWMYGLPRVSINHFSDDQSATDQA